MIHSHAVQRAAEERNRIYAAFRNANALDPTHARTLADLGLDADGDVRSMRKHNILREVKAGMFYLDEDARREYQWVILRWTTVPVILVLAFLVFGIVYAISLKR